MSTKTLALGIVIGGAVSSTLGRATADAGSKISALQQKAEKARVLQGMIGETQRLQREYRELHRQGAAGTDEVLRKLNGNLDILKRNRVEVSNLGQEYRRMGDAARAADLRAKGTQSLQAGSEQARSAAGDAIKVGAAVALPTKVAADYGAIIRDIAIKAGIAGSGDERQMSQRIVQTSREKGMGRNEVAALVNQLVSAGMDYRQALGYAGDAAAFSVGQGAGGDDVGKLISALRQNAQITDPREMKQALEAIAFQGQAGSFESPDMARWMPQLLAQMQGLGITGMDSVAQMGAMLQVQMKTTGSADEAANNLKNWMSKIGSGETVKRYADAGFKYQEGLDKEIAKGSSTLEASFKVAQAYIEQTDPARAAEMAKGMAAISREADPAKAQRMMRSLDDALKTGDLFADMQVKAALGAYMQHHGMYEKLKVDSRSATGILEKNLRERRAASQNLWREFGQAWDGALLKIGEAMQPTTDWIAVQGKRAAGALALVADKFPTITAFAIGAVAAMVALRGAVGTFRVVKGVFDILRAGRAPGGFGLPGAAAGGSAKGGSRGGSRGGAMGISQVYVTNWPGESMPGGASPAGGKSRRGGGRMSAGLGLARGALPFLAIGAAVQAADVYQNARTRNEKAEGYGAAAGGLGGAAAGAMAGAALGSVVPIIGTAIGGMIGGVLGGMGGNELGGVLGKALFGQQVPSPAAVAAKPQAVAEQKSTPAVPPVPPPQEFTFQPHLTITVQGDVKDPRQLANSLFPHLRSLFNDFSADVRRRSLFDSPNV